MLISERFKKYVMILLLPKLVLRIKKVYKIPKSLVEGYDGHNLLFKVTKDDAKSKYEIDI
jgi:hypothetical protein